jgi:predicted dehydrogenase
MAKKLRLGLIGAGANTRSRHIPGFLALEDVELVAVCNRRPESSAAVAREFSIPRVYQHWEEVIADPDIDAISIGTWPYLHCPITLAALKAGKHVLTEARLSMNAAEAHRMYAVAKQHPNLITQVVPSPFGLKGHEVMRQLLESGFLGELREVQVFGLNSALADPASPLSWRQDITLSGFNMLTLGIVHETLLRWVPPPIRVLAQVHAHIPSRIDPQSGVRRGVGTPDSVQVLAILKDGARAIYHFSGVTAFGQSVAIHLYGTEGTIHYDLLNDRIFGATKKQGRSGSKSTELEEIPIPSDKAQNWRVEAEFVEAIRLGTPIRFTDFATGVAYMEFTEAVARSAETGEPVELPLEDFAN